MKYLDYSLNTVIKTINFAFSFRFWKDWSDRLLVKNGRAFGFWILVICLTWLPMTVILAYSLVWILPTYLPRNLFYGVTINLIDYRYLSYKMVRYFTERLETPGICFVFMIRALTKKTKVWIHVERRYFKAVTSNYFTRRYLLTTKPVLRSSQFLFPLWSFSSRGTALNVVAA